MVQKFPRENDRCDKRRVEIDYQVHLSSDKLVEMTLYSKTIYFTVYIIKLNLLFAPPFNSSKVLHRYDMEMKSKQGNLTRAHGKNVRMARPRENA